MPFVVAVQSKGKRVTNRTTANIAEGAAVALEKAEMAFDLELYDDSGASVMIGRSRRGR